MNFTEFVSNPHPLLRLKNGDRDVTAIKREISTELVLIVLMIFFPCLYSLFMTCKYES